MHYCDTCKLTFSISAPIIEADTLFLACLLSAVTVLHVPTCPSQVPL